MARWTATIPPGRDRLVDEVVVAVERARSGAGSVVLLTGEAGIGKTSIARAVAHRVDGQVAVTWATCPSDRGDAPLAPWRALIGPDAEAGAPPPRDPSASHAAVGAARLERLTELCDRVVADPGPRLHVLDDLQWADVASVLLLARVGGVVAGAPLVVVATVRTGEPLSAALDDALAEVRRHATVVAVPPLGSHTVDALVRDAGIAPDSAAARGLLERTGGNPLLVTELLRAARLAGPADLERGPTAAGVPERVAALVAQRLTRLPGPVGELVVAASVLGAEGDAATLAAMRGSALDAVVELVEQARAARFLDAATAGRWRFRHDLVRDAVYASATAAERARLHAAALAALEQVGVDAAARPATLAHHALSALPLFDAARAARLATAAGLAARAQHAYEEALAWFEQALGATPPESRGGVDAELTVLAGETHRCLGQIEQARQRFVEAAARSTDPDLLGRCALGFADPGADLCIAYRTEDATTGALLEQAVAAQRPDAAERVLLEARLAAERYFSEDPRRARELADTALDRARAIGDAHALVVAGAVAHDAFAVGQAPLADQLAGSAQLLAWAEEAGTPAALLTAHRARVFDLLAAGDVAGVDAETLAFRRIAEPLGVPGYRWWLRLWGAMRALLEGRHDAAEAEAFAAFELGERTFPLLAFGNLSFLLFFLRREQGRLDELEGATRAYAADHADIPAIRVAHAFLLAETGRHDEARGALTALAGGDLDRLRDRNWPASWFQLARSAFLVGDRDLARTLAAPGHRPDERCVSVSLATVCLGAVDLGSAWLAHALADLDAADAAYAAAERRNAAVGARSWLAQTRADRAAALVARDGPGDRAAARALADLAREAAEAIGLRSLDGRLAGLEAALAAPTGSSGRRVPTEATFRRAGPVWEVAFAGLVAQVPHRRGMHDLAALLARPGEAVPALELLGEPAAAGSARGAPALDERARREIRARLAELDAEVDDAEAVHDGERAALARERRQQLAEAVARDLGLGGRARRVGDPVERARKTVSTRIRRTIAQVAAVHPELGRHLERSIDTGAWCAYRPAEPVLWTT